LFYVLKNRHPIFIRLLPFGNLFTLLAYLLFFITSERHRERGHCYLTVRVAALPAVRVIATALPIPLTAAAARATAPTFNIF
jgi:hypothetical protein